MAFKQMVESLGPHEGADHTGLLCGFAQSCPLVGWQPGLEATCWACCLTEGYPCPIHGALSPAVSG